jgi:hypothetical protein
MSVKGNRLYWRGTDGFNKHGDPVLTITAVGTHDVYRLAHHMQQGQVEFCRIGTNAKRALKRKLGKKSYDWLLRHFHGDGGWS